MPDDDLATLLTRQSKLTALDSLVPWEPNPNEGDVEAIAVEMRRIGWWGALIYQAGSRRIIVGNHRALAAQRVGLHKVPAMEADVDDATAEDIALFDNRSARDLGRWKDELLAETLARIDAARGLARTGFDRDYLSALQDRIAVDSAQVAERGSSLLERSDVSVGEPEHPVAPGDVWSLGPHVLCCVDLMAGWPQWIEHLRAAAGEVGDDRVVFVPYPGPYVALTTRAEEVRLVMVQPDAYVAGHVLSKWIAIRGEDEVRRWD